MRDLFSAPQHREILDWVDWSVVGVEGTGAESTFWLGSAGAYTQCHMDTYGWNVVAQLHGRKRWTLFAPSNTSMMHATRIPYEESSVFSRVNIAQPDLSQTPLFASAVPTVIVLNPGDVLYVPKHWWHHVQCMDAAVSVNMWQASLDDEADRLREALVCPYWDSHHTACSSQYVHSGTVACLDPDGS